MIMISVRALSVHDHIVPVGYIQIRNVLCSLPGWPGSVIASFVDLPHLCSYCNSLGVGNRAISKSSLEVRRCTD